MHLKNISEESREKKLMKVSDMGQRFHKLNQVGEGTYGKVYKAEMQEADGNKSLVALKKLNLEADKEGFPVTAIHEIQILAGLKHPNIAELKEILTSKATQKNRYRGNFYLVFEYMEYDLYGLLDNNPNSHPLQPAQIKHLLHQLLEAIEFLHNEGIMHRDIKSANVLLDRQGHLKLTDFGLAIFYRGRKCLTQRVVTLWYRAPELLLGMKNYSKSIDLWSVGCCFAEMLMGKAPLFKGDIEERQIQIICEIMGTPTEHNFPGVTKLPRYNLLKKKCSFTLDKILADYVGKDDESMKLLVSMLSVNPNERISASEALKHDYFTKELIEVGRLNIVSLEECHEWETKQRRRAEAAGNKLGLKYKKGTQAPDLTKLVMGKWSENPNYYKPGVRNLLGGNGNRGTGETLSEQEICGKRKSMEGTNLYPGEPPYKRFNP